MNIDIKELNNDSEQIKKVQKFLFDMIKQEFGYDYVPEWHQDIVNMDDYYIGPERNAFFVAYTESGEVVATIGIRAYDKNFDKFKHLYSNEKTSSIWRLFVDRRYRRCGLASKMFSIAEKFGNENGYDDIYLHTHKTLPGALKFWTKMGFLLVSHDMDLVDTICDDKIYLKDINAAMK